MVGDILDSILSEMRGCYANAWGEWKMAKTPDEVKRKATSILAQIAQQVSRYWLDRQAGRAVTPPHLMDVAFLNANRVPIWLTIEPEFTGDMGVQGWDIARERMVAVKWQEMWDTGLNMTTYEPIEDYTVWRERWAATNLEDAEDTFIQPLAVKFR